ncbi:MAG: DNA replication/repair protein RecF [Bacteroidota bacterium]|nr:DNA replication/repair protein RecF [Bacteroidota bacterium]
MFLKTLQLHQFKNHSESKFTFTKPVNCFVGNNGAGKTNILDAIHYLSQTKSYFNHIDSQNIQFDEGYFMLKGTFDKDGSTSEIQCNLKEGKTKNIQKNNKKYSRFSEHIGQFPIIIISPTDTNLILEDSEVRRKYLDSSIAQYKQSYLQVLIQYNKALKQRNVLLKQFYEEGYYDDITLEIYDKQLIEHGNIIHKERKNFLKQLTPVFNKYYSEISEGNEVVDLEYKSQLHDNDFSTLLLESKPKDRIRKTTQVGTHKDDIIFKMNTYPIKKIGSQGQQKSFLIALKLAQFDFIKEQLGFKPILLLDDIFDKLDDHRILKLISFVDKNVFGQVFITDTHTERSATILSKAGITYSIYTIENGKLTHEGK